MAEELHRLFERFQRRFGQFVKPDDKLFVSQALADAEEFARAYTGRDELPAKADAAVVDIAIAAYNKRGAEGESSRSEGGISRAFEDIPPTAMKLLDSIPRKVGVIHASYDG